MRPCTHTYVTIDMDGLIESGGGSISIGRSCNGPSMRKKVVATAFLIRQVGTIPLLGRRNTMVHSDGRLYAESVRFEQ